jgi:hypothetical protein
MAPGTSAGFSGSSFGRGSPAALGSEVVMLGPYRARSGCKRGFWTKDPRSLRIRRMMTCGGCTDHLEGLMEVGESGGGTI